MPQQTPEVPAAPAITPHQVTVNGVPIASAYDVYQAFRAQRRVLGNQMDDLQNQRDNISRELQQEGVGGADRKGLEQRMTTIDGRIDALDKQIAEADAQVAKAAAVPGAAVDPPEPPRSGPPEEFWVITGVFRLDHSFPAVDRLCAAHLEKKHQDRDEHSQGTDGATDARGADRRELGNRDRAHR